jgi:predicted secreted Zn-dependent protease
MRKGALPPVERLEHIDRFAKLGLRLCALWPLVTAPAAIPPLPVPAFAPYPGVRVEEYVIAGDTTAQIDESLAHSPIRNDIVPSEQAIAATWLDPEWHWSRAVDAQGRCTPADIRVTLRTRVMLPRLLDAPAAVAANWRVFRTSVEEHEAEHLRIGHEGKAKVTAALAASDCDGAEQAAAHAWHLVERKQAAFDALECHADVRRGYGTDAGCAPYEAVALI